MGRTARVLAIALPALIILIGLGTWQAQRLGWKQDLIATMEAQLAAPPVALPVGGIALDDWTFRPVQLTGAYLQGIDFEFPARTLDGKVGTDVLTPFVREEGEVVLVHRGWVPDGQSADPAPTGEQAIEAIVREPWHKTLFRPDNDPAGNQWFWMEFPAMQANLTEGTLVPYYVALVPPAEAGDALPIARPVYLDLPNNHLEYALTWYALAAILAVITFLYLRRA